MQDTSAGVNLPATHVARRYAVTTRTIDRWLERENLNFPRPIIISARRYWPLESLVAWEASQAASKAGV
jgi:predicted DNA-binding transcriptional regulator AlpA